MTNTAIIGAGLAGLTLGLALHKQGVSATIYESRPAPLNIGGAVMLSPNALRILDALGVYDRILSQGYSFELNEYIDVPSNTVVDRQEFGNKAKYGYKGLRVYRHVLIDTLLEMLKESSVAVKYGYKFAKILDENDQHVKWEWADGSTAEAQLLVGADGIHSTVRKYLYPDLVPKFTNMAGITAAIPASHLKENEKEVRYPLTFMVPGKGGFVIAPQQPDASEMLIGKQRRFLTEPSRAEWDAYSANKPEVIKFLQSDNEHFPKIVQDATTDIPASKINVWPFYVVPKLDSWASEKRRVVILGDSAHAIPPSAGQGINQAFEDVYMFALLLAAVETSASDKVDLLRRALTFWQDYRQKRVEGVLKLNHQIDLRRVAPKEGETVQKEPIELGWLYNADFKGAVDAFLAGESGDKADKELSG